jgi:hypothetical protein
MDGKLFLIWFLHITSIYYHQCKNGCRWKMWEPLGLYGGFLFLFLFFFQLELSIEFKRLWCLIYAESFGWLIISFSRSLRLSSQRKPQRWTLLNIIPFCVTRLTQESSWFASTAVYNPVIVQPDTNRQLVKKTCSISTKKININK